MGLKGLITFLSIIFLHSCVAPPVTKNKEQPNEQVDSDGLENYMEYHRYLREVVNTLESDPEFKRKLEKASEDDIRSGKIAYELEFVNHHIRTRLDEIKRTELDRLKELTEKKKELIENNSFDDPTHHHLDHSNPHTFEIEDLRKLIAKTTQDLAEADRKRREEFKQYELQKEFEKQEKLNHTGGEERTKLETEIKEMEEKHKKHEKLHEPGHKQQLEEVWEEQDRMQQDFDPKTFFMLHDLDSNGLWDQTEVKALFVKELDKMYAAGAPEDDMRERAEEMELMRESVFREVDINKDGFIDYNEFIAQTKRNDFQQDHGWQGIDEQKPYTDEELEQYIKQHQAQAQQAYYQQMPPSGMAYPAQMVPPGMAQPGQMHPGQYPPHNNQMSPGGGYHPMPPNIQSGQNPPAHLNPSIYNQGNIPDLNTNEISPNEGQQRQNLPIQQNIQVPSIRSNEIDQGRNDPQQQFNALHQNQPNYQQNLNKAPNPVDLNNPNNINVAAQHKP